MRVTDQQKTNKSSVHTCFQNIPLLIFDCHINRTLERLTRVRQKESIEGISESFVLRFCVVS